MNLSTQLRIILLLVGAAIWLAIYWLGRRRAAQRAAVAPATTEVAPPAEAPGFLPAEDIADEFETPAYLRRQGTREPRQDYEPRIASAHDYVNMDDTDHDDRRFVMDARESLPVHDAQNFTEPVHVHAHYDDPVLAAPASDHGAVVGMRTDRVSGRREPTISLDESAHEPAMASLTEPTAEPIMEPIITDRFNYVAAPVHVEETAHVVAARVFPADIPVVEHPVTAAPTTAAPTAAQVANVQSYAPRAEAMTSSTAAPTLSEVVSLPAAQPVQQRPAAPAPTADAGKSPANPARRKIIALRIPTPERVPGAQLLSLLQGERLQHGKFSIFNRLHDGGTVFSVASMVEPGTFDPHTMSEQQFSGVTLFMLLPGPLDGLVAYDQMLSCAQRLAHATNGVLQDERGSKLTSQIIDKLRDEVLDFQHLLGAATVS